MSFEKIENWRCFDADSAMDSARESASIGAYMETIYFGGPHQPLSSQDRPLDLDAVTKLTFRALFGEWVQQVWMQEVAVPNSQKELENFNIEELIALFRKRYVQGDWRRIVRGRGATVEWFVLWLQLLNRHPTGIVLNSEQPSQATGRITRKLSLPTFEIGACLIQHLRLLGNEARAPNRVVKEELGFEDMRGTAVMIYDGKIGHVIQARTIDDSLNWMGYDDFRWREGSSMLCAGENAHATNARFFGRSETGQWVTSAITFPFLIYGIPVQEDALFIWEQWAQDARRRLDEFGRR